MIRARPLDLDSHLTWLRIAIALVWFLFGLLFKALGAVPRHKRIVARVVGAEQAGLVLWMVAFAEVGLGTWMLFGRWLVACAGVQTAFILAMNAFELRYARDLLPSPIGMVCANVGFLALGWYVALMTV